MPGVLLFPAEK